jgi:hypothetical protein
VAVAAVDQKEPQEIVVVLAEVVLTIVLLVAQEMCLQFPQVKVTRAVMVRQVAVLLAAAVEALEQ